MEFRFDVEQAVRSVASSVQGDGIAVIYGEKLSRGMAPQALDQIRQVVDAMGYASGKVSLSENHQGCELKEASVSVRLCHDRQLVILGSCAVVVGVKTSIDYHNNGKVASEWPHYFHESPRQSMHWLPQSWLQKAIYSRQRWGNGRDETVVCP